MLFAMCRSNAAIIDLVAILLHWCYARSSLEPLSGLVRLPSIKKKLIVCVQTYDHRSLPITITRAIEVYRNQFRTSRVRRMQIKDTTWVLGGVNNSVCLPWINLLCHVVFGFRKNTTIKNDRKNNQDKSSWKREKNGKKNQVLYLLWYHDTN